MQFGSGVLDGELTRRYANVRAAMAEHDLDALIVAGSEYSGFEGAVTYLTGFQIVHRYAYVVVPAAGEPHVVFPAEARYVGEHGSALVEQRRPNLFTNSVAHIGPGDRIEVRGGVPTTFTLARDSGQLDITVTPRWQVKEDAVAGKKTVGAIGVVPAQTAEDLVRVRYGPLEAVAGGAVKTWKILETTIYYLGRMITGQVSADQLRGPLGIADVTKKVTTLGAEGAPNFGAMLAGVAFYLVRLVALISISVGFMNLLPVPVLDGGHLLFYGYEALARRPLAAKVQAAGYRVGLALVLGLMLFATWNDLQRLRVFNLFGSLFS